MSNKCNWNCAVLSSDGRGCVPPLPAATLPVRYVKPLALALPIIEPLKPALLDLKESLKSNEIIEEKSGIELAAVTFTKLDKDVGITLDIVSVLSLAYDIVR